MPHYQPSDHRRKYRGVLQIRYHRVPSNGLLLLLQSQQHQKEQGKSLNQKEPPFYLVKMPRPLSELPLGTQAKNRLR